MDETEGAGFVIRDKRGQSREESASEFVQEVARSSSTTTTPPSSDSAHSQAEQPLSFSSFIFSLGTSALMLMGEKLAPEQSSPAFNLPQAKEIIDILSLLEEKTKGNLTEDEMTVIRDILYSLRMKYVGLASDVPPSA